MTNRVVHFEMVFDDQERASTFYQQAFGWQLMPMPEMDYVIVGTGPADEQGNPTEAGFIGGGMMQRQGEFSGTNIVVDVSNIEEALKAVTEAGGSTVQDRMQVGDMGFVAYFKDTEGNLVGLWENA